MAEKSTKRRSAAEIRRRGREDGAAARVVSLPDKKAPKKAGK